MADDNDSDPACSEESASLASEFNEEDWVDSNLAQPSENPIMAQILQVEEDAVLAKETDLKERISQLGFGGLGFTVSSDISSSFVNALDRQSNSTEVIKVLNDYNAVLPLRIAICLAFKKSRNFSLMIDAAYDQPSCTTVTPIELLFYLHTPTDYWKLQQASIQKVVTHTKAYKELFEPRIMEAITLPTLKHLLLDCTTKSVASKTLEDIVATIFLHAEATKPIIVAWLNNHWDEICSSAEKTYVSLLNVCSFLLPEGKMIARRLPKQWLSNVQETHPSIYNFLQSEK